MKNPVSTAQLSLQYRDVKAMLDAALASGGGTVTLRTPGKATHFRQRCYTFMKAWREAINPTPSKYDVFVFPQPTDCNVVIKLRETDGIFTPAEGGPVTLPEAAKEEEDELLDIAKQIGVDLDLD